MVGKASEYDKVNAVYPEDLIGYFQEAWPDRWEKFCKGNPQNPEKVLIQKTVRELEKKGTLDVLRHGFKVSRSHFRSSGTRELVAACKQ